MSKLGHFYFKLTSSGNLLSEYSFEGHDKVVIEGANRINGLLTSFEGDFEAIWIEKAVRFPVILHIELRLNTKSEIFKLTWKEKGTDIFTGEGFIVDGILIGSYKSV
jgi:hypothetical protein